MKIIIPACLLGIVSSFLGQEIASLMDQGRFYGTVLFVVIFGLCLLTAYLAALFTVSLIQLQQQAELEAKQAEEKAKKEAQESELVEGSAQPPTGS